LLRSETCVAPRVHLRAAGKSLVPVACPFSRDPETRLQGLKPRPSESGISDMAYSQLAQELQNRHFSGSSPSDLPMSMS
jgi:hypothetical protein